MAEEPEETQEANKPAQAVEYGCNDLLRKAPMPFPRFSPPAVNRAMGALAWQFTLSFHFLIYFTTWISVSPFAFVCTFTFSYSFVHVLTVAIGVIRETGCVPSGE
jgi:hypothetical protein